MSIKHLNWNVCRRILYLENTLEVINKNSLSKPLGGHLKSAVSVLSERHSSSALQHRNAVPGRVPGRVPSHRLAVGRLFRHLRPVRHSSESDQLNPCWISPNRTRCFVPSRRRSGTSTEKSRSSNRWSSSISRLKPRRTVETESRNDSKVSSLV